MEENDKKEDDEITLDFNKVAFWKRKKSKDSSASKEKEQEKPEKEEIEEKEETADETPEAEEEKAEKEEEEKEIEERKTRKREKHSKKKRKKEEEEEEKEDTEESEDDVSFDMKKTMAFCKKYAAVILIIIPIIFMIWFRSYPTNIPAATDWAQGSVHGYYRNMIDQQIRQQYPNLPDEQKNELIEEQFSEFLKTNKGLIDQQIQQTAVGFREQLQDENGYTYLADIDSYIWLRYARNIVEHGYSGDELITGKEMEERTGITGLVPNKLYNYDNHMMAPLGALSNPILHPFVIAYAYKVMKPFNSKLTLSHASFLVPIILSIISIIAAFFIGRKVAGNTGGFFAAMIIAIHPFFISRTYGSDTDVYNVLFPLLIVWFFIEAFEAKDSKKGLIYASLAGAFTGLFSFVWLYWYVFDFILAAIGIYFVYYIIMHWKGIDKIKNTITHPAIKKLFLITVAYIIVSGIFVTIFAGFGVFANGFLAPLGFVSLKASTMPNLWPNVYTTVAELNAASWDSIIGSIGGRYLFFISIIGILLTVLKKDEHGKPDMKYLFLFTIWYIATIYASFKGVRFVLLLVPAFAIGIGAAIGISYEYLRDWVSKSLNLDKKIVITSLLVLFFIIIFISPGRLFRAAHDTSKNALPLVNDAWWETLTAVKEDSSENAIINSWWDFGHHFKYIADRAVTFDGASQNIPQAHWIGKSLLTDDEEQTIDILRMLDCGGNSAFERVQSVIKDTKQSVDIVYKIISLDKETASGYLKQKGFSDEQVKDIIQRTHCEPPEDYFITSEDMIGKSGVWGHFGSWNFDRANIWLSTKGKSKEETINFITENTDYTKEEAETIYFEISAFTDEREANNWIAPWPSYASGPIGCLLEQNTTKINCINGIKIDLSNYESEVPTQGGIKSLDAISYMKDGQMIEKISHNNTMGIAGSLIKRSDVNYDIILMQAPLHKSIFHRLFYMNADGLKHFDKLIERINVNGQNIIVWKVDWEGRVKPTEAAETYEAGEEEAGDEAGEEIIEIIETKEDNENNESGDAQTDENASDNNSDDVNSSDVIIVS